VSVDRATASASLTVGVGRGGTWATTAVCGANVSSAEPATAGYLVESELDLGQDIVFGRIQYAQKSGRDLALARALEGRRFGLGSVSVGYAREFGPIGPVAPGVGFVGSVDAIGGDLEPYYGGRFPVGGMVFVRLRPARMAMPAMAEAHHGHGVR
jgi:hypothetical protein